MSNQANKNNQDGATAPPAGLALTGLSLCMLLSSLGTSIANVGLPTFAQAFHATFQQVQWILLAYLLAITSLIVGAGRLGDVIGRRRLMLLGLGLFAIASALCSLAASLPLLVAARAAQGLGASVMMAQTMALVAQAVPKARIGSAMGMLGTTSAIGTALGPTLGGILIATFGWPAIFLINLPLALVAYVLIHRYVPADANAEPAGHARFDLKGMLLLAMTLAAYSLAMTIGRGDFGASNAALLLASAGGACIFWAVEKRTTVPLIDPATMRSPNLTAGFVMSALVTTVVMATLVVGPFYLAGVFGFDTARVGVAMSCGPAVAALTGAPAGRLVDSYGAYRVMTAGLLGMAAGTLGLWATPASLGVGGYIGPLVVITAGYALFQAANNTAVMNDAAPAQRGVISGMLNMSRNLGLVTGAALMGAVFAFGTGSASISTANASAIDGGMRLTFGVAGVLILIALGIACAGLSRARRTAAQATALKGNQ